MTHLPILIITTSLLVAFVLPLLGRHFPRAVEPLIIGIISANIVQVIGLLLYVNANGTFRYALGGWSPPWGIALSIDALGLFMILIIQSVSLGILIFARDDLIHEIENSLKPWYYTLFLLLLTAMTGLSVANDFFNVFVFMEISTITACAIIAIKPHPDCIEASLKYLILSTLGSGLVLFGLALVYMVTGYLSFDFIAESLPNAMNLYPLNIIVSLALLVVGMGIKAALFPLHVWLPDAHSSAVSPSSAILSGVVVKIYAVILIRLLYTVYGLDILAHIPISQILLTMATLAIFMGSLFAMGQTDIKRMLAYSSVAQIGYIFLGIALLSPSGITGGILHIANHAIMKSLLFLAAGAIIYQTGIRKIKDLVGIGYQMPLTMGIFGVGALAMVGIPGFNGFVSKFHLAVGALEAQQPVFVIVILISSLMNAVYYFPILIRAFFGPVNHQMKFDQLPLGMVISLIGFAVATIYLGLLPGGLINLAEAISQFLLSRS